MKKLTALLLTLFIFCMGSLIGQKAKFKTSLVDVQKIKLPEHASAKEDRTYDIVTKGLYSLNIDPHGKKLYGWERVDENPNVKAVVSLYGFNIKSPKLNSKKKEKKDKDGKVTDSWTEYWYTNSGTGRATLHVYGMDNPFKYNKRKQGKEEKTKYEQKQEAKEEEMKKDLADNPFLSTEDTNEEEAEENDEGEDSGLDNTELEFVGRFSMDRTKNIKGDTRRSRTDAYKAYRVEREKLSEYRTDYPNEAYKSSVGALNKMYGFAPVNNRVVMQKLKTDDHPEYKMWNDAVQATETLFKTFAFNEPIEDKQSKFDPILLYFKNQFDSVDPGDKKQKKLRKAAYTNIINIMFYLDRHQSVVELCRNYIDDKKLDKISKRMIESSEKYIAHLAFHDMNSCHFDFDEEVDTEDIQTEGLDIADDEDDDN